MITFILQVKKTKFREIVAYPPVYAICHDDINTQIRDFSPHAWSFFFFLMALSQIYCDPDTLESCVPLPTATHHHGNVS